MRVVSVSALCREATRLNLATNFNTLVAANAQSFGVPVFVIDFTKDSSVQYFNSAVHPDDLEESTPTAYPVAIHYTVSSENTHEQFGAASSGPVAQNLTFWFSDLSQKVSGNLERIGDLVEAVITALFGDGNWPQNFGANAVCARYPMARTPVDEGAAQSQRQGFTFRLQFDAVVN